MLSTGITSASGNVWDCDRDDTEPFDEMCVSTELNCRTIRIGTYKYVPKKKVFISREGIRIVAPNVKDETREVVLQIVVKEIVKVLVHFGKALPVIFLYTKQACGNHVRKLLDMTDTNGPYYNPVTSEDPFKRITLLLDTISDEAKMVIQQIFGRKGCLDRLTPKEANQILFVSCPQETDNSTKMVTRAISQANSKSSNPTESRQILIYPPGKGGITIYTDDYVCLAQDQFLNDVIIDFYLKYLCHEKLTSEQREKTHIFSTFFYKRLTTKPSKLNRSSNTFEFDSNLTPAQKRHARVKGWTKNVNLFEKDFIVVPINESCHWFLAIVCFPSLEGCRSIIDNRIVTFQELKKKDRKEIQIGNTTITSIIKQDPMTLNCDGDIDEEKDEAEAEESDLDMVASDSENEETEQKEKPVIKQIEINNHDPIKQPCILIFDSLAGASRSRVVATLRDYLTCEYWAKVSVNKTFNKDNMKGACPKVPQQNNFTDCGLYLLQYVEQFFKIPIHDYTFPIKQLSNWFDEIVVTRKREEISDLLKSLMAKYNPEAQNLPEISFPTLNGKLVEVESDQQEGEESAGGAGEEPSSEGANLGGQGATPTPTPAPVPAPTPPRSEEPRGAALLFRSCFSTPEERRRPCDTKLAVRHSQGQGHSQLVKDAQNALINKKLALANADKNTFSQNSFETAVRASNSDGKNNIITFLKSRRIDILNDDSPEVKRLRKNDC